MKMELRNSDVSLKSNGDLVVSGYVNKPGQLSQLLGSVKKFKERIKPGAFRQAIENRQNEIDFLAEHDSKRMLASTRNNSLTLREDEDGVYMEARISDTSYGRDYFTLIADKLISSMSFGFRSLKDSWTVENGVNVRTVEQLELYEVSAVKEPAYLQSSISARNIELVEEIEVPDMEQKSEERGNLNMEKLMDRNAETQLEGFIKRGEVRSVEGVNTTGAGEALIPENVFDAIVLKMEETSPVFAKARKFQSVAGTLKIARENDKVEAAFVGEGAELKLDEIGFEQVKLEQKRVGAALKVTNDLINDSAVDIVEYCQNLLARRTVKVVEKSIFNGIGGAEFNGILNDPEVKTVSIGAAAITLEALQDMYLAIHPDFLPNASFIMQRSFYNEAAKLKDGNGHFYIQNGVVNGKLTQTMFGLPIDITDALPAEKPVVFGNITEAYGVMIKKQAEMKRISGDTANALAGTSLIVLDAHLDGAVINPDAVVVAVRG